MKASLVINQTMILILAVIVLAVLVSLWYVIGGTGASEWSVRLELERACNAYVRSYPDCNKKSGSEYNNMKAICNRIPGLESETDPKVCCKLACGAAS